MIPDISIATLQIPDDPLYVFLTWFSGIFWTIAYIVIIYRGFKDKTCGMPLLVLGLNWGWEFTFAFLGTPFIDADSMMNISWQSTPQRIVDGMWFFFDCVILFLKFKYGKKEFDKALPNIGDKLFYPYVCLILLISVLAVMGISVELEDHQGAYAAYQQNIFISSLFIPMALRHGNTDGQSMIIAISKCLGTIAPSAMGAIVIMRSYGVGIDQFLILGFMPYMKLLICCCLMFDVAYIILLYRMFKKEGKNPWTRKPLDAAK